MSKLKRLLATEWKDLTAQEPVTDPVAYIGNQLRKATHFTSVPFILLGAFMAATAGSAAIKKHDYSQSKDAMAAALGSSAMTLVAGAVWNRTRRREKEGQKASSP
jgi:hypothetical protein